MVFAAGERHLLQAGTEETRGIRRRGALEVSNDVMRQQRQPLNPLWVSVELDERAEADEGEEVWKDLSSGSTKVQRMLKEQAHGEGYRKAEDSGVSVQNPSA